MNVNNRTNADCKVSCPFVAKQSAANAVQKKINLNQLNIIDDPILDQNLKQTPYLFFLRDCVAAGTYALAINSIHAKIVESTPVEFKNYIHLGFIGLSLACSLWIRKLSHQQSTNPGESQQ